jgi:UPF0716 protein FxsA
MNLFGRLFVLFVLVPVIELALLIQIGRAVGLLPTVGLVLLTGAAGAWLARAEGMRVFFSFQNELQTGRLPGQAVFDGLCVLVGGALLLTPGVLTDLVGFALLLPPTRRWIQRRMRRSLERRIQEGSVRVVTFGPGGLGGFGFGGPQGPGGTSSPGRARRPEGARGDDGEAYRDLDPSKGIEVRSDEG